MHTPQQLHGISFLFKTKIIYRVFAVIRSAALHNQEKVTEENASMLVACCLLTFALEIREIKERNLLGKD